ENIALNAQANAALPRAALGAFANECVPSLAAGWRFCPRGSIFSQRVRRPPSRTAMSEDDHGHRSVGLYRGSRQGRGRLGELGQKLPRPEANRKDPPEPRLAHG